MGKRVINIQESETIKTRNKTTWKSNPPEGATNTAKMLYFSRSKNSNRLKAKKIHSVKRIPFDFKIRMFYFILLFSIENSSSIVSKQTEGREEGPQI